MVIFLRPGLVSYLLIMVSLLSLLNAMLDLGVSAQQMFVELIDIIVPKY